MALRTATFIGMLPLRRFIKLAQLNRFNHLNRKIISINKTETDPQHSLRFIATKIRLNKMETDNHNTNVNINEVSASTTETSSQPPPHAFKVFLVDITRELVQAWTDELKKLPTKVLTDDPTQCLKVQIHHGTFQNLLKTNQAECLVSPANSFGLMDGGIDYYISEYYGGVDELIPVVQKSLDFEWCGEQNVGTCLLVDVRELATKIKNSSNQKGSFPGYIAHCPTMRIPKVLDNDDLVYRCTWAMLTAIKKHNVKALEEGSKHQRINAVVCAGFGTGVGGLSEELCAKQMMLAINNFVNAPANAEQRPKTDSWLIQWSDAAEISKSIDKISK
ncbi:337_t:CDS:2 [Gigaspora margarita]|uniref:337_t:CDS:1 n=1 Tax=Gigaspora margarita TaxID=4874 RepID=A0ABM8VXB1_GIGMA|nr:337_t:CDS:2 [Gigaspora margarita]